MARRKTKGAAGEDKSKLRGSDEDRDLLTRIRERFKLMEDADHDNRVKALDDLEFVTVPGKQWDDAMRLYRGTRPCYEFNELRIKCQRIVNDMRANRPQAKIRGYEDSTKPIAEIFEGLGRNIWNCSDGDTIVDNAALYQVMAGMTAWRVTTEYQSEASFDQDIVIEGIQNPFCLYCDPSAKDPLKRDAEDWILTERVAKSAYEAKYPDKRVVDFEASAIVDDQSQWVDDETVRIAEYSYKKPVDVEIWQLADGKVIESTDPGAAAIPPEMIARKRTVKSHKIMSVIVSGDAVLDGPNEVVGKEHDFVMIYGEVMVVKGRTYWHGLPRFGKDAQRNFNTTNTAAMESSAQSLNSKNWATTDQAKGLLESWQKAFQENLPFVLYNPDPKAPGPPIRIAGPDVPVAMLQLSVNASNLMKSVTGVYDASLGAQSNETTGRAIIARQQQGEIATFNYQDNMSKGRQRTWEILIDRIPRVYDTERSLRILGADGAESYVKVNEVQGIDQNGQPVIVNDLNQGRYDVTITTGPNFSTKRQEATEVYGQLIGQFPQIMSVAGDLIAKAWDLPYSEQIAERMQTLLPPQIQQTLNQGKKVPPEIQQAMAQVSQAMQQVQQQGQMVQQAAAELQQEQALNGKQKAEINAAVSNLKTAQANFDKDVAERLLAIQSAQFAAEKAIAQATNKASGDVAQQQNDFGSMAESAVSQIQEVLAGFMQAAAQTMTDIQGHQQMQAQMQAMTPPKPKVVAVHLVRQNGKSKAVLQYEGDPEPGAMPQGQMMMPANTSPNM